MGKLRVDDFDLEVRCRHCGREQIVERKEVEAVADSSIRRLIYCDKDDCWLPLFVVQDEDNVELAEGNVELLEGRFVRPTD